MKFRTSVFLVPFALAAMGFVLLTFTGCGKGEKSVDPASPESYMNDKAFMGKLAAERTEQRKLIREHGVIAGQMKAMIEAKKAELKTDDLKLVQAALEKDPVWTNLYAQCLQAKAKSEEHRRKAFGIVRERLAPKARNISK